MSTKTAQQFEVGDFVETAEGWRGVIKGLTDLNYGHPCTALVEDEEGKVWRIDADYGELALIVCEYCGSRQGCECQENIDAREAEAARAEYERGRDEYHAQIAQEARR